MKSENKKLPSWANAWIKNSKTGEVKPAFDCHQTWLIYDENGDEVSSDWKIHLDKDQIIGFAIFIVIAIIGACIAAFLYFGAKQ